MKYRNEIPAEPWRALEAQLRTELGAAEHAVLHAASTRPLEDVRKAAGFRDGLLRAYNILTGD